MNLVYNNPSRTTYVYIVQCMDKRGWIKVGVAVDVDNRLSTLQIGCPYELKLIAKIKFPGRSLAYAMESKIHRRFKGRNVRGEWFTHISMSALNKMEETLIFERDDQAEIAIAIEANSRM